LWLVKGKAIPLREALLSIPISTGLQTNLPIIIAWSYFGKLPGDVNFFGTQDGRDGYDFIEWLAKQIWCSGKIGMFGNFGVAMPQWHIAAEQPPHLTCIA